MPCNYKLYPADWKQRRARILERAGHCCEQCGIPDHAVGYRDKDGYFVPNRGSGPCDASGWGREWRTNRRLTFAEASEFVEQYNDHFQGKRRVDWEGNHWFVIVLTVAHLNEGELDVPDDQLRAWCQRCHIRHDAKAKAERLRAKRLGKDAKICLQEL